MAAVHRFAATPLRNLRFPGGGRSAKVQLPDHR